MQPVLVFQNYTQYIPLSIYDLQTWMGSPSIFVYDCSNAGLIVKSFKQFALQREQELEVRCSKASSGACVRCCREIRKRGLCVMGGFVCLGHDVMFDESYGVPPHPHPGQVHSFVLGVIFSLSIGM